MLEVGNSTNDKHKNVDKQMTHKWRQNQQLYLWGKQKHEMKKTKWMNSSLTFSLLIKEAPNNKNPQIFVFKKKL
jgi:hypothetical protein